MADKSRFSELLLRMIETLPTDGETMIAISRAILRNDYTLLEFGSEFLTIFKLIDDEGGDIVLDGYGEFNTASERYSVTDSNFANTIKIIFSRRGCIDARSNTILYRVEIQEIKNLYYDHFQLSLQEFRRHFGI